MANDPRKRSIARLRNLAKSLIVLLFEAYCEPDGFARTLIHTHPQTFEHEHRSYCTKMQQSDALFTNTFWVDELGKEHMRKVQTISESFGEDSPQIDFNDGSGSSKAISTPCPTVTRSSRTAALFVLVLFARHDTTRFYAGVFELPFRIIYLLLSLQAEG